ncbi:MAG: hypothetical protein IJO86_00195 [Oscillospiraceae bacterium]|nr:hypothetical protein [Oscillospiraceae bacterium]
MKKIGVLLISLLLIFSFASCGSDKDDDTFASSAAASLETEKVAVLVSGGEFPQNTVIKTQIVKDTSDAKKVLPEAQSIVLYDINATLDDKKVQPNGEVEVSFPLPKDFDSSKHLIEVYYISDDGQTEKIEATVSKDDVVARLKHFSFYAVVVTKKPSFNFAVNGEPSILDGQKVLLSDKNLTFTYNPDDTWKDFVNNNKDAGFFVDKDFYGKIDVVYFVDDNVKYQVLKGIDLLPVNADDIISEKSYGGMIPHRETIQCQWLYEVSNEPFMVEGYLEPFTRQAKIITIDPGAMTYIIKHEKLQRIATNSFIREEKTIASGKYTSDDGDTLGATLTLDNGYIIKTTRENSFAATLIIDGKSITTKTADQYSFYDFN